MFRHYRNLLLIAIFEYHLIQLTFNGIAAAGSYNVTRAECINANGSDIVQKTCCKTTDMDEAFNTCLETLHPKLSDSDDNVEQFIKLSPVIACMYKKKNFIRSESELNMTAVKSEAKRLYKKDSVQKKYVVELYKICGQYATNNMFKLRNDEEGRKFMKEAYYPYFFMVYGCTLTQSFSNCPYFRWKGKTEENIAICKNYAHQCKKRFFKSTTQYLRSLNSSSNI